MVPINVDAQQVIQVILQLLDPVAQPFETHQSLGLFRKAGQPSAFPFSLLVLRRVILEALALLPVRLARKRDVQRGPENGELLVQVLEVFVAFFDAPSKIAVRKGYRVQIWI